MNDDMNTIEEKYSALRNLDKRKTCLLYTMIGISILAWIFSALSRLSSLNSQSVLLGFIVGGTVLEA